MRNIDKYLEAVDTVCLDCDYLSEDNCATCPVRLTVERMNAEHEEEEDYE